MIVRSKYFPYACDVTVTVINQLINHINYDLHVCRPFINPNRGWGAESACTFFKCSFLREKSG